MEGRTNILPLVGGLVTGDIENCEVTETNGISSGKFVQISSAANLLDISGVNGNDKFCFKFLDGYICFGGNTSSSSVNVTFKYVKINEQTNSASVYSTVVLFPHTLYYGDFVEVGEGEIYFAARNTNSNAGTLNVYDLVFTFEDDVLSCSVSTLFSQKISMAGSTPYCHFFKLDSVTFLLGVEAYYDNSDGKLVLYKFLLQGGALVPDANVFDFQTNVHGDYGCPMFLYQGVLVWICKSSNYNLIVSTISVSGTSLSSASFNVGSSTIYNAVDVGSGKYICFDKGTSGIDLVAVSVDANGSITFGEKQRLYTSSVIYRVVSAYRNGEYLFFVCGSDSRLLIILCSVGSMSLAVLDTLVVNKASANGFSSKNRDLQFAVDGNGVIVVCCDNFVAPINNVVDNIVFMFTTPKVSLYRNKISGVAKTSGSIGDTIQVYVPHTSS